MNRQFRFVQKNVNGGGFPKRKMQITEGWVENRSVVEACEKLMENCRN